MSYYHLTYADANHSEFEPAECLIKASSKNEAISILLPNTLELEKVTVLKEFTDDIILTGDNR